LGNEKENIKEMGKSELPTKTQVLENYLEYVQDKDNSVNQPGDPERNENGFLVKKKNQHTQIQKRKRNKRRKSRIEKESAEYTG